ncbi:DUF4167 domain-containing protein [Novosphingobium aquiterrae]|uniref:DUF4167 domain-containing protein n=1 Tax=Novosphingobium aquiterrae TaxID=624388 RepID=A0ABV6PI17_9SPHN
MNNNNRGNNNRRRGRGNRPNGGGSGGGQQLNRIDSRARGNAPQLLEKYRKLAQDAHLNGDRVQAEYYLQFADHYFRVIADTRVRQEEQRNRPQGERWQESADENDDGGDFNGDADFPSFDQPSYNRQPREDRPRREERPSSEERDVESRGNQQEEPVAVSDDGGDNPYEPPENPFVREREPRGSRGLRPRRERDDRGPRRDSRSDDGGEPAGLDPTLLPPAIAPREEVSGDEGVASDGAKPRRGRPRKKPSADDAGETLESVN